jgi:hypothetical protein
MRVIGDVRCTGDVTARTCVKVRIQNLGDRGDGSCQLWGKRSSDNGNSATAGMKVVLTDVENGAVITKILPWNADVPKKDFYFTGLCAPGLKS